jgi:hypothetical protein
MSAPTVLFVFVVLLLLGVVLLVAGAFSGAPTELTTALS